MKVVTFGEIMLRLAPNGHYRFFQDDQLQATFGGGEANVSVSQSNNGKKSILSPTGSDVPSILFAEEGDEVCCVAIDNNRYQVTNLSKKHNFVFYITENEFTLLESAAKNPVTEKVIEHMAFSQKCLEKLGFKTQPTDEEFLSLLREIINTYDPNDCWIPTETKMPTNEQVVLISVCTQQYDNHGIPYGYSEPVCDIARYSGIWHSYTNKQRNPNNDEVIAWKPLPAPCKFKQ